jgi:LysR family transcriptional regulator, flagellar master operon regulator
MIAQICERARQRVGLPSGRTDVVGIGCELSLWSPLLSKWLVWMRDECPEIGLNATVAPPAHLLERVQEGSLDVAILYNPPTQYGLAAELLSEEKLVLVSTLKSNAIDPERYVHVDWGTAFNANLHTPFWQSRRSPFRSDR